ncbi:MAG: tRNA (adenosine(37)-N6)-threonylcarbamoyltransferase complex ATPase subunit type 1 TsaE [Acidobacteria bacterium]|nr:tRNA (adenosine(37)-N6)-threonylcarbamoyltransferase complex ATPase subunit type 1 TsaE [Acidobacteriota bacterium]
MSTAPAPVPLRIVSASERETFESGQRLAAELGAGQVVLFQGDLGTGKTVFIRGICAGLGCDPRDVRSPSFTLVNEYRGACRVLHADLYRLEHPEEIDGIGIDDLWESGALVLVEWAQRLPFVPPGARVVTLRHLGGDEREICVESPAPSPE